MVFKPRYLPAGDSALVVEFGATIDSKIHDCVLALDAAVQQANWEGVTETVPTYRSLMIHFDPRRLTTEGLADARDERVAAFFSRECRDLGSEPLLLRRIVAAVLKRKLGVRNDPDSRNPLLQ